MLFLILILLIICSVILLIKCFRKDKFKNKNNKNKKNKDIIIFSSGPSLNEIKNYLHIFTPEFYNKYYIVGIKDSAIFLDKLGIKVDYFIYSSAGYKHKYKTYKFKNSKNINKNFGLPYSENKFINAFYSIYNFFTTSNVNKKYINIDFDENIIMNCVMNNKKDCFTYKYNGIKKIINDGHIMCDQAIPLAIELNCKNIYCLGWDICENAIGENDYSYFNKDYKENFENKENILFKKKENIFKFENIREFTKYLPKYLKNNYNINIFKLSNKQCVNLPLFNINNL